MSSETEWTVERALREGRADLLLLDGEAVSYIETVKTKGLFFVYVSRFFETVAQVRIDLRDGENVSRLALRHEKPQPEPDGPPRDWPSIWRQQLREHIERAPMIPQIFIDEVLDYYDEAVLRRKTFTEMDEVKP